MSGGSQSALDEGQISWADQALSELIAAIQSAVIGQEELIRGVVVGLLTRGNILLEGQPGLGKTLLVKALASALELSYSRIQFTPDLMPADITGTQALVHDAGGRQELTFRRGPVFAHVVLADEINRATPKTQSALLEAMQEHAVTVAGERMVLEEPFVVIATQNPIEMEGTYPLPEAQLDRFLLKLTVPFPDAATLRQIGLMTTGNKQVDVQPVMDRQSLLRLQQMVREITVAPHIADLAAQLTIATHPEAKEAPAKVRQYVRYGASPRAVQALILAGRARALMQGRPWVTEDDLVAMAHPILRHRMILSFEADLEKMTADVLVDAVIEAARRA